jgi:diketogulonate reductase-like aldo/keto reductase
MLAMKKLEMPKIIYGTAWKEDATAELTKMALTAGFRAIDTANQKKHYREDYVGQALREALGKTIGREHLFLQSKYTYQRGQDHRLPYNPDDDLTTQVNSSFASSLEHLNTDYLDSYLLHGPSSMDGLTAEDWEVWRAMEQLYKSGKARLIGVSNVMLHHLTDFFEDAEIKPMVVQNRCFAVRGWDEAVREFCAANQVVYQGFSLLTANRQIVDAEPINAISRDLGVTPEQVVLRFASQIGILPLTGTTNPVHMKHDLDIFDLALTPAQVNAILDLTR